jgi:hypothetical protein
MPGRQVIIAGTAGWVAPSEAAFQAVTRAGFLRLDSSMMLLSNHTLA